MAWSTERILSERPLWFFSGRLALDFAASGTRGRSVVKLDRLRDPESFARWRVDSGLVRPPSIRLTEVASARVLREAIFDAAEAAVQGKTLPRAARAVINERASRTPLVPRITSSGRRRFSAAAPVEAALATIARDAIDLLVGPDRERLRECASTSCGLLFVDRSHAGRRRWCTMDYCGNRVKVASYRRRKASAEGIGSSKGRRRRAR
jgi:predicted RNA-binding Zn ribbon-like protein